jgi:hypothetical protein
MFGAIVGGALIFGVSEVFGEVYHSWNRSNENNVLIKAGNKLADCTEVLEDKAAEVKIKVTTKKNYKNACKPKAIAASSESLSDALVALDKQIQNINKEKSADVLAAEANLISSVVKVCDLIVKENKLAEEDVKALEEIKAKGEDLYSQLMEKKITNQNTAKKKIKEYVNLVQPFIDKNIALSPSAENQSGQANNGTTPGTFSTEEEKIPNFAQNVKPLTVSDVRDLANNNQQGK